MIVKYFETWDDAQKYINKNGLSVVDSGLNDDWNKGKYYVTVWGTRKD